MQAVNRLLTTLKTGGRPALGIWQTLPGIHHTRTLAKAGYDWICVDTEHGNIDDGAMHDAVGVIASCGVSPLVRVAADEGWMIKRALDTGAHGIVVPLLRTVDQAKKIVQAAKFPPEGQRGFGSPFAGTVYGDISMGNYLQQANQSLLTIVQIETREALANVEEIAQIQGIDVLFIGPFDLGNNIGYPIRDGIISAELKDAIARILKTAKANKKPTAIYSTSAKQAREFAEQGFEMISVVTDVDALHQHVTQSLKIVKET